jgi:hypothetical protein
MKEPEIGSGSSKYKPGMRPEGDHYRLNTSPDGFRCNNRQKPLMPAMNPIEHAQGNNGGFQLYLRDICMEDHSS